MDSIHSTSSTSNFNTIPTTNPPTNNGIINNPTIDIHGTLDTSIHSDIQDLNQANNQNQALNENGSNQGNNVISNVGPAGQTAAAAAGQAVVAQHQQSALQPMGNVSNTQNGAPNAPNSLHQITVPTFPRQVNIQASIQQSNLHFLSQITLPPNLTETIHGTTTHQPALSPAVSHTYNPNLALQNSVVNSNHTHNLLNRTTSNESTSTGGYHQNTNGHSQGAHGHLYHNHNQNLITPVANALMQQQNFLAGNLWPSQSNLLPIGNSSLTQSQPQTTAQATERQVQPQHPLSDENLTPTVQDTQTRNESQLVSNADIHASSIPVRPQESLRDFGLLSNRWSEENALEESSQSNVNFPRMASGPNNQGQNQNQNQNQNQSQNQNSFFGLTSGASSTTGNSESVMAPSVYNLNHLPSNSHLAPGGPGLGPLNPHLLAPTTSYLAANFENLNLTSPSNNTKETLPAPFQLPDHSKTILKGLDAARKNRANRHYLCDVLLQTTTENFYAHRAVLATCSPYFKSMFELDMRERELTEIDLTQTSDQLSNMTAEGLSKCLDFLYTGEVILDINCVLEVLKSAHYLQLNSLLKFCCEYVTKMIDEKNLIQISDIAKFFSLNEISEAVIKYILDHFDHILKSGVMVKLPLEDIKEALADKRLRVRELKIFYAAHLWLTHDESRLEYASELMSCVRFQLIDAENIEEICDKIEYMMNEDYKCMRLILDAQRYHMLPNKQPLFVGQKEGNVSTAVSTPNDNNKKQSQEQQHQQNTLDNEAKTPNHGAQIRATEPVLIALGGKESTNQVSNSVQYLCHRKKRWQPLTKMPAAAYCHCVAVFNDFLFVAGGQEQFDNNGNTALSACFRYDPRSNSWRKLQSMLEPRTDFHLSAFDSTSLVAVAGRNQNGPLSSCERYNIGKNKWEKISSLPIHVCAHAGATLNGCLYIAGGFAADGFQRGCYKLSKVVRKESGRIQEEFFWERKASLNTERGLHCMVQINQKLYAIGGNNKTNGYRRDVIQTDMYDPKTDTWTEISPLFEGQSEAGAAVVKDQIYVVGGHTWRERKDVRTVACYDSEKDQWSKNNDFPEALTSVACCSIKIPSFVHEDPNLNTINFGNIVLGSRVGSVCESVRDDQSSVA